MEVANKIKYYLEQECQFIDKFINIVIYSFLLLVLSLFLVNYLIVIYKIVTTISGILWVVFATMIFIVFILNENKPYQHS